VEVIPFFPLSHQQAAVVVVAITAMLALYQVQAAVVAVVGNAQQIWRALRAILQALHLLKVSQVEVPMTLGQVQAVAELAK
jgi:VIT1/CCC1 family predicted Fe2+/Mn2+ transporter